MRAALVVTLGLLIVAGGEVQARERRGSGLEKADANGDGVVSQEEFNRARADQFTSRDRNRDGVIDKSDLGERANRPRIAQAVEAMIKQFDANGDAKLTKIEFVDGGARMFERADTDKSGSLDKKEIEGAKAVLRDGAGR